MVGKTTKIYIKISSSQAPLAPPPDIFLFKKYRGGRRREFEAPPIKIIV